MGGEGDDIHKGGGNVWDLRRFELVGESAGGCLDLAGDDSTPSGGAQFEIQIFW